MLLRHRTRDTGLRLFWLTAVISCWLCCEPKASARREALNGGRRNRRPAASKSLTVQSGTRKLSTLINATSYSLCNSKLPTVNRLIDTRPAVVAKPHCASHLAKHARCIAKKYYRKRATRMRVQIGWNHTKNSTLRRWSPYLCHF